MTVPRDPAFDKALAKMLEEFKHTAEAEVRKRWREEEGLIFVREYTVRAHVYRRKKRRPVLRLVPHTKPKVRRRAR